MATIAAPVAQLIVATVALAMAAIVDQQLVKYNFTPRYAYANSPAHLNKT